MKLLPNEKVVTDGYYSVKELMAIGLPEFPGSPKGWYDLVKRDRWEFRDGPGRGGKSGQLRKFKPPMNVMALIEAHQQGTLPPAQEKTPAPRLPAQGQVQTLTYGVAEPEPRPEERPQGVDSALLRLCLGACTIVYSDAFAAEPAALQLEYVADLYNQVVRHAASHPAGYQAGLRAYARLETRGLADQLRLFLQMDLVRPYRADNSAPAPGIEPQTG